MLPNLKNFSIRNAHGMKGGGGARYDNSRSRRSGYRLIASIPPIHDRIRRCKNEEMEKLIRKEWDG